MMDTLTLADHGPVIPVIVLNRVEHAVPMAEALVGGALAKVRSGDVIRLDARAGTLDAHVDEATWAAREVEAIDPIQADDNAHGIGRELFAGLRRNVNSAEQGACSWL